MSIVSRDVDMQPNANKERDKQRSDRLKNLIGIDSSQRIKVCDVELEWVDHDTGFGAWQTTVPSIIEVFPLSKALPIFEVAAVSVAVRGQNASWDGLKWICLLKEDDPDDMVKALRDLSEEIRLRTPGTGHTSGSPEARRCTSTQSSPDTRLTKTKQWILILIWTVLFSYEKDYLQKPSQSFWFPLERRHAEITLDDRELPLT